MDLKVNYCYKEKGDEDYNFAIYKGVFLPEKGMAGKGYGFFVVYRNGGPVVLRLKTDGVELEELGLASKFMKSLARKYPMV